MPVLFIGHGNPMNAIADNAYTRALRRLGTQIGRPRAILCVSAHWMTQGTWVTHMRSPKTIHDFHGFPDELFAVEYPAPGAPEIAELARQTVKSPKIQLDDESWGYDHGAWAVLRHMYPKADVPVVQLSDDLSQPPSYHFQLARKLRPLRDQGVLILASGNIVHNLPRMLWREGAAPYDWAIEFDEWVKRKIVEGDFKALVADTDAMPGGPLSVPSPDHWYPLLYALGAADSSEPRRFEYEGIENGSISMRCVSFGLA